MLSLPRAPHVLARVSLALAAALVLPACLQEPPPDLTVRDAGIRADAGAGDGDAAARTSARLDAAADAR